MSESFKSPKESSTGSLAELSLDDEHFCFLRNYLPSPKPPHGVKHKHDSLAPMRCPAVSPIPGDGEEHCDKRQRRVPWTHTEDVTILALHRHHGTAWETIAAQLPGRTSDAVRNRCFRLQKQHPLASSQDGVQALDGLVMATHGISPPGSARSEEPKPEEPKPAHECFWGIGSSEGARRGVTGTDRGHGHHDRHTWNDEEDRIIMEGVARLGCKWREISKFLQGRSDSSIRNRWMRLQKDHHIARSAAAAEQAPVHMPETSAPIKPSSPPIPLPNPLPEPVRTPMPPPAATLPMPPAAPPAAPTLPSDSVDAAIEAVARVAVGEAKLAATVPPPPAGASDSLPVPLGHDFPDMELDLDCFTTLAFDETSHPPESREAYLALRREYGVDEGTLTTGGSWESLAPPGDSGGRDGPEDTSVPPTVKLASAFLATFAAVSFGALMRIPSEGSR